MILGLTGSIGSGKTFVTHCFEQLGAFIVRADDLAREVIQPDTPGFREVVEQFGHGVLTEAGAVDRRKLAEIVFADSAKLRQLEAIIHPRVREREIELLAQNRHRPLIVLEIPLLYESGADDLCDKVLVVTIDENIRRERLLRDRGMKESEVMARIAMQMPQHQKVARADYVIDNSGSREETRRSVETLFQEIMATN